MICLRLGTHSIRNYYKATWTGAEGWEVAGNKEFI
jgi:hypothetical protein